MRSPTRMGAVLPSSRWLARGMVERLDLSREGMVIELGAGTGVVTQALLECAIDPSRLLIVERDPKLHALLVAHYPRADNVCADAQELAALLAARHAPGVSAVLSSLPLLSIPRHIRRNIVEQMAQAIGENGEIIQFTYGPKSPIDRYFLELFGLRGEKVKTVIANMPPAHIWVYRKAI